MGEIGKGNLVVIGVCGDGFAVHENPERMAEWILANLLTGRDVRLRCFERDKDDSKYASQLRQARKEMDNG